MAIFLAATGPALAGDSPTTTTASLDITVRGIKSAKGVIRLAICPPNAGFPDCKGREVRSATLPIENGQARIRFADLPAGTYGISVFHDANANSKLDTFLGIPKEGATASPATLLSARAHPASRKWSSLSAVTARRLSRFATSFETR